MNKNVFSSMAFALAVMVGCQSEDAVFSGIRVGSNAEIVASLECESDSRTALSGGNKVVWNSKDTLSVFVGSANAHNTFVIETGEDTPSATFKSVGEFSFGTETEDGTSSFGNVAYYPKSSDLSVSQQGGTYTINATIPECQVYREASFGQDASPMVAVSETMNFAFKNVASMLKVSLKKDASLVEDVTIIKATLKSKAKKIAGACTVTASASEVPSVAMSDDAASIVTLSCGEGVRLNGETATEFYFVIPPGTYAANDLVLTFYDSSNRYFESPITAENTFLRSKFLDFARSYVVTGNASGADAANDALKNGSSKVVVTITDNDENPTLELPASSSEEPTELTFESIPEGKVVTIQATTESADVADSLVIKAPASQSGNGCSFDINLPNSTVTLAANGEAAIYNEVIASTADNTLIVGEGVTVTTLKVKKGNVRVFGKIETILREQGNSDAVTYIIKEEDAVIPTELGDGFKVVSAAAYDLIAKFKEGGSQTIRLEKDVELPQPLTLTEGRVTVELNYHTITALESDAFVVTGNAVLTITGVGVVQVQKGANGCAVWAHHGGEVIINGGTFSTNDDAAGERCDCIYAGSTADMSVGKITINGGTFKYDGENEEGHKFLLNKKDGTESSIIVNSGTFHKFNPAVSYGEPDSPVDFVASNSIVAETAEGVFEVIQSFNNRVQFEKDITIYSPIEIRKGDVTLDFGNKTLTATRSDAIVVTNGAKLIIDSGTIKVQKGANGCAVWAHHNGEVIINGGTFSTNDDAAGERCDCIYAGSTADLSAGTITINGGTFKYDGENEEGHKFLLNKKDRTNSSIVVNGGIFHKFNPAISYGEPDSPVNLVAPTSIVAEIGEGIFKVIPPDSDRVVRLYENIELNSPIVINNPESDITLDLYSYKITSSKGDAIVVTDGAQLTITDSSVGGLVQVLEGANGCAVWAHHGGKVTIEKGTFSTNDDAAGERCDCIYAGSTADMSVGTITINGGTFKYDGKNEEGHKFLLNKKDNTASSISVTGGKFYKFNPAISYGEPDSPVNFVAEGFEVVPSQDGYYTVQAVK